jgi:hypothetical protein
MTTEVGQSTVPPPPGGQPSPPPVIKAPGAGGPAPIQIQWDDLNTRRVDQRLKEQAALERNRRQAAMDPLSATTSALAAEDTAAGRAAPSDGSRARRGILSHPAVALALFGLLGGLLAWGVGLGMSAVQHDPKAEAARPIKTARDWLERVHAGQMSSADATEGIATLKLAFDDNPYFMLAMEPNLDDATRAAREAEIDRQQWPRRFVTDLLAYGLAGMLIAACLAAAEPLLAGNRTGAVVNGVIGAAAGLAGGVVVSLFAQRLFAQLAAGAGSGDGIDPHRVLAYAAKWGVLGLFVTIGPGLAMRNGKKFAIGLLGGLVGGLVGGAAYDPIYAATGKIPALADADVSRLVALVLIGVVAGALTGLVEHAARTGWLRVTAGLIAGKQFILYRNPTFIGSGPECPIYLFKDPAVGRRHAAIHVIPGGFEVENLPIGSDTLVNGRPVTRARLRNGDELQVGATRFRFQEKAKA